MKQTWVKYLSYAVKILGALEATQLTSFLGPEKGVIVFLVASILKDTVNRISDYLDDGQLNNSNGPKA